MTPIETLFSDTATAFQDGLTARRLVDELQALLDAGQTPSLARPLPECRGAVLLLTVVEPSH